MIKRVSVLILILSVLLCGCTLAQEDHSVQADVPKIDDMIIGILVTTAKTDEADDGTEIHSFAMKGQQLYARLAEESFESNDGETATTQRYHFPEGSGYAYMGYYVYPEDQVTDGERDSYWTNSIDDGIYPEKNAFHAVNDNSFVQLEGTVYVEDTASDLILYVNPVYQTAQGEVYALGTAPVGYHAASMYDCSVTYSQNTTETVNDATQLNKEGYVKMTIKVVSLPTHYDIIQMDAQNQIISTQQFTPAELPESFAPAEDCAYFILESHSEGEPIQRWVYSPDDDSFTLDVFYPLENGICHKGHTKIDWGDAA